MEATIKAICEGFSEGNFTDAYPHFDEHIQWQLIGNDVISGKDKVIAACDKMLKEMAGSKLVNTDVTEGDDRVAVEGYCNYTTAEQVAMQVQFCDVYATIGEKIQKITSYCIDSVIK